MQVISGFMIEYPLKCVSEVLNFYGMCKSLPFLQFVSQGKSDGIPDSEKAAVFPPVDVDAAEEEDEFSLAKIKEQLGFADDEDGTFVGLPEDSDLIKGDPSRLNLIYMC